MPKNDKQIVSELLPQQILVEASDWHIRCQDEPDNLELREQLDLWRAGHPDHARAWALLSKAIELSRKIEPLHVSDCQILSTNEVSSISEAPLPVTGRRRTRGKFAKPGKKARRYAYAAVAASLLTIMTAPDILLQLRADHVSGTAQTSPVRLADGSFITLGAESAIAERFTAKRRDVELISGEAWFDVVSDPARPFHVTAGDMTVIVTGTAFDVSMTTQTLSVGLARGSVRVERNGGPPVEAVLKPGQRFAIDRDTGRITTTMVSMAEIGAWRSGRLAVRGASLTEVLEALDRHYRGRIVVRGNSLKTTRVTGVYDLNDPAGSLQMLALAQGLHIRRFTPWLTVISAAH